MKYQAVKNSSQDIPNRSSIRVPNSVIPGTLYYGRKAKAIVQDTIVPGLQKVSRPIKQELIQIHRKQNLLTKFRVTLLHKAMGLYLALLSARLVGNFIEVRSVNNLWGLFPQRQLVSETTFGVISFCVEFIVALTVFTLSEHYLGEWLERRRAAKRYTS